MSKNTLLEKCEFCDTAGLSVNPYCDKCHMHVKGLPLTEEEIVDFSSDITSPTMLDFASNLTDTLYTQLLKNYPTLYENNSNCKSIVEQNVVPLLVNEFKTWLDSEIKVEQDRCYEIVQMTVNDMKRTLESQCAEEIQDVMEEYETVMGEEKLKYDERINLQALTIKRLTEYNIEQEQTLRHKYQSDIEFLEVELASDSRSKKSDEEIDKQKQEMIKLNKRLNKS